MHIPATSAAAAWEVPSLTSIQEVDRLSALDQLQLLDTPREESFDRIVRLIRDIFDVPIALVSLMDGHRQWHKACSGSIDTEAERKGTFCQYPIATGKPLVVTDARLDPVLSSNPHVVGKSGIRFYAGIPLRTREGHAVGTVCAIGLQPREFDARDLRILSDLADVAMHEIELRQQAETDVLTGLLSRRAFKNQGGRAVDLSRRHDYPLACAAIDIDHSKVVNDTHGHSAGDAVLAQIALACRSELRTTDILSRIGGEEFAVLLPHTSPSQAMDVAEKLRVAIRRTRVKGQNVILQITASIGIASLDKEINDLDPLLARADAALYEAKAQGRDRCISARRAAPPRRRVLKGGRIVFNNRFSTIDCTIRSLGEDGAGVDVWSAHDVPDTFTLMIAPEGVEKLCRVTRVQKHVEVDFC